MRQGSSPSPGLAGLPHLGRGLRHPATAPTLILAGNRFAVCLSTREDTHLAIGGQQRDLNVMVVVIHVVAHLIPLTADGAGRVSSRLGSALDARSPWRMY